MSADQLKAEGNKLFQSGDHAGAVKKFTAAIAIDPTNAVLYSNRSAAYSSMKMYVEALADADKAVELRPDWSRAYSRRTNALFGLERFEEARDAAKKGLEIEPTNQALNEAMLAAENEIRRVQYAQQEEDPMFNQYKIMEEIFKGDIIAKLRMHPKTAEYTADPEFCKKMIQIQQNPSLLQTMTDDTRIIEAFGALLTAAMPQDRKQEMYEEQMRREEEARKAEEERKRKMEEEARKAEEERKKAEEAAKPEPQKEAEKEKAEGNKLYAAKKYDEAIVHYRRAMELYPDDATYISNLSACILGKGDNEGCIAECDKGLAECRRLGQYKILAKILCRKGIALRNLKRYEEAIECFRASLTEDRNKNTLALLNETERTKRIADEQAYIDPAKAQEAKERGNNHFKRGEFPDAVKEYSEAIRRSPDDAVLYSNRSAAYAQLGEYQLAVKDADKCIELNPAFVKGYTRKGLAHYRMKENNKALEAYRTGLSLDTENEECRNGIMMVNQRVAQQQASEEADPEALQRAMADPEIRAILQDPVMMQVLDDMKRDPAAAQHHLSDPHVVQNLEKLMTAGVIRMG